MRYATFRPGGNSGPLLRVIGVSSLALLAALELSALDVPWKSKPAALWSKEDSQLVLSASPWAKQIMADVARRQSEDELREGGQMGQPQGIGYDGVDAGLPGYKPSFNIFTGKGADDRSLRSRPRPGSFPLGLRWESSLPVRLAKFRFEGEPEALDARGYQIGVYGLPDSNASKGSPTKLGSDLRGQAVLKREGKKDVRPVRVEVFRRETGPVILYLFPLSAEITVKDQRVEFEAGIGRIVIHQGFDLTQMEFMGKLEL